MLSRLLYCGDLTDTLGSSGARLKAVVALAAVASHCVDTAAVLADAGLGAALVQVCGGTEKRRVKRTMLYVRELHLSPC